MPEENLDKTELENQDQIKGQITLLFDFFNSGDFNIILDLENPNDTSIQSFALFLTLLKSSTKVYDLIFKQIKTEVLKNDENINKIIEAIFLKKKTIDSNLDVPAILPRDVFKRVNPGV